VAGGEPAGTHYLRTIADGPIVAGINGDVWDVHDDIRRLIRSRQQIDPASLTDPGADLESLAASSRLDGVGTCQSARWGERICDGR
jgi:hypothetical protein